jgi:hypothetical protein
MGVSMPVGTITKRYDNPTNIRVTFDGDRETTYSTNKKDLYDILREGATVEYTVEQHDKYWNIATAVPSVASVTIQDAPAGMPTDRDTIILDEVIFKGAIDLQAQGHSPEGAAELAIATWGAVRSRHLPPLVAEAVRQGGQLQDDV